MQFKVPQFIEVEDTLFGPFTFRQFIYLIGGGGMIFLIYKIFPLWIGIFLIIPVLILSLLLVFYKINEKPFIYYLEAGLTYFISSKLYIWKQRLIKPGDKKEEEKAPSLVSVIPVMNEYKLKDLAWSLDVKDNQNNKDE